tara:strand:+ start:257 stop:1279 length:1023 start_codon:yes stop_codon:yes gene_type:complete
VLCNIKKQDKLKLLTLIFTAIILTSCNGQVSTVKDTSVDLSQGKLTYSISGEGTNSSWELEILFNENNAIINEEYAGGAGRKYIYDKNSNEILGLISDAAWIGIEKDKYFIYYTPKELIQNALSSNYGDTVINKTQEFKDILGYKCQKSIIKHGNQVTVEVWTTDKIKPGVIYPWTPLVYENIALEYEIKILGKTDRKYVIQTISDDKIDDKYFVHNIPDEYYLIVPASIFSIDSMWTKDYEDNNFKSFTYPYYNDGRLSTIKLLQTGINKIVQTNSNEKISINFFVNKDGTVSEVEASINYEKSDERIEKIKLFIKSLNEWTPAKVKGKPVKSKVTIFG